MFQLIPTLWTGLGSRPRANIRTLQFQDWHNMYQQSRTVNSQHQLGNWWQQGLGSILGYPRKKESMMGNNFPKLLPVRGINIRQVDQCFQPSVSLKGMQAILEDVHRRVTLPLAKIFKLFVFLNTFWIHDTYIMLYITLCVISCRRQWNKPHWNISLSKVIAPKRSSCRTRGRKMVEVITPSGWKSGKSLLWFVSSFKQGTSKAHCHVYDWVIMLEIRDGGSKGVRGMVRCLASPSELACSGEWERPLITTHITIFTAQSLALATSSWGYIMRDIHPGGGRLASCVRGCKSLWCYYFHST